MSSLPIREFKPSPSTGEGKDEGENPRTTSLQLKERGHFIKILIIGTGEVYTPRYKLAEELKDYLEVSKRHGFWS